ncbi:MAG: SAM-dependent methyltransferase [Acidobacteria bacterium]|nr:SAM-dependent methyltransferase [Acidobacteriota bacterium]
MSARTHEFTRGQAGDSLLQKLQFLFVSLEEVDTTAPDLIERRKAWNKPAPATHALPTEIWRETVARRNRCEEIHRKLAAGDVAQIAVSVPFIVPPAEREQGARSVCRDVSKAGHSRRCWG